MTAPSDLRTEAPASPSLSRRVWRPIAFVGGAALIGLGESVVGILFLGVGLWTQAYWMVPLPVIVAGVLFWTLGLAFYKRAGATLALAALVVPVALFGAFAAANAFIRLKTRGGAKLAGWDWLLGDVGPVLLVLVGAYVGAVIALLYIGRRARIVAGASTLLPFVAVAILFYGFAMPAPEPVNPREFYTPEASIVEPYDTSIEGYTARLNGYTMGDRAQNSYRADSATTDPEVFDPLDIYLVTDLENDPCSGGLLGKDFVDDTNVLTCEEVDGFGYRTTADLHEASLDVGEWRIRAVASKDVPVDKLREAVNRAEPPVLSE